MSRPAISVENLSKAYRIGLKEEIPDTLAGAFTGFLKSPFRNLRQLSRLDTFRHQADDEDIFWALKDVSFEVQEGEVLGVIGRNGAGKSTLLKILSRITEPTSGRAVIRGRVSSLLEVGTGFHPELSGRENVYLNGTILGMTKAEIDRKFDEIVDFSGVEKFLDTPIKRYSSGMKVRLAFAVAAHLEPEILIIDEVLAVGDAEFQKKCLGKMQDVASHGRTVLFVSHNMAAVRSLTTRTAFLKNGSLKNILNTDHAIDAYLDDCEQEAANRCDSLDYFRRNPGQHTEVRITDIAFRSPITDTTATVPRISADTPIIVELIVDVSRDVGDSCASLTLTKAPDTIVATVFSPDADCYFPLTRGRHTLRCELPPFPMAPGRYALNAGLNRNAQSSAYDVIQDFPLFEVVDADIEDGTLDWPHRPWGALHFNTVSWSHS